MSRNIVAKAIPVILMLLLLGGRQYSDYKEGKQIDDFKSSLQSYLLEGSTKATLLSVRVDGSTLALVINVKNQQVNDEIKARIASNSSRILIDKVCNGVGLRDWLVNGHRVSIDIKVNGDIYGIANISITESDCT